METRSRSMIQLAQGLTSERIANNVIKNIGQLVATGQDIDWLQRS